MAMQRNNIARLPWEIREQVCRLRFDGRGNAEIAAAVQAACRASAIRPPKVHGTSILAYSRSDEYRTYCDRRRKWDERMAPRRWAAALVNEGAGPQTVADLALQTAGEELAERLEAGGMEPGEMVQVARAVTDLQRTLLARTKSAADSRLREMEERHAAESGQLRNEIAGRDAAIAKLKAALIGAGVDPDAAPAEPDGGLSAGALREIEERAKLL
jgi:hypothetical protein